MTDRELLELAANPYWGDEVDDVCSVKWSEEDQAIEYTHGENQDHNGYDTTLIWSPLTDDGDALRLAVKLGICVTPYPIFANPKHSVIAKLYQNRLNLDRGLSTAIEIIELYNNDPYAATRRAIVRAAAEIGKALK